MREKPEASVLIARRAAEHVRLSSADDRLAFAAFLWLPAAYRSLRFPRAKLPPEPLAPSRDARCGIAVRRNPHHSRFVHAESTPLAAVARRWNGNGGIVACIATLNIQSITRAAGGVHVNCPHRIRNLQVPRVARPLRRFARVMSLHVP